VRHRGGKLNPDRYRICKVTKKRENMSALEGVKVVEFTSYVSGPYAGMLLADFGADVVKVEPPETGDPFRRWGEIDYNATFGSVNRNKKSVTIDLKSPEGHAQALRLMDEADVVIENLRSGSLDRMKLGWDIMRVRNPRLMSVVRTFGSDWGLD
jgi:formyl-CoA transferase